MPTGDPVSAAEQGAPLSLLALFGDMRLLDLTLSTAQENLACDEVLLDRAEAEEGDEILRLWVPTHYFVVAGYGNDVDREVHIPFCRQNNIPILRRCSGGGTVLQGPGVLNYSLILRTDHSGPCHSISAANQFVMERHRDIVASLIPTHIEIQGHTDLTIRGLKFSGNSQRRKKRFLLFHGSFLLDFDLALIESALPMPSKEPHYRQRRSHSEFLTNLGVSSDPLKTALSRAWAAHEPVPDLPFQIIASLARTKYSSAEWNLRPVARQCSNQ
jgi:lipoate-protein ligase A